MILSFLRAKGEKEKKSYYNTGYSNLVTHSNANPVKLSLTLLSELNMLLTNGYCDYAEFFFLIS